MSAKIRYTSEPIGDPKVIRDFLPSPRELAFREEDVKVTITLSKKSVDFFKSEAARGDTQYQRMIRRRRLALRSPPHSALHPPTVLQHLGDALCGARGAVGLDRPIAHRFVHRRQRLLGQDFGRD